MSPDEKRIARAEFMLFAAFCVTVSLAFVTIAVSLGVFHRCEAVHDEGR